MIRWEILEKAKEVLEGEYGNGDVREWNLKGNYRSVQKVVNAILEEEDNLSEEIERHKEEIRKLELMREKEEKNGR